MCPYCPEKVCENLEPFAEFGGSAGPSTMKFALVSAKNQTAPAWGTPRPIGLMSILINHPFARGITGHHSLFKF
jgi:hypothetical protein